MPWCKNFTPEEEVVFTTWLSEWTRHRRFWPVCRSDALLIGTAAKMWSYWKLQTENRNDSEKLRLSPKSPLSRSSRSPAASGRYLRRSCGSFLRLTFASVECGQAADTVLCQKVNAFLFPPLPRPHPTPPTSLRARLWRERSSLVRTSPTHTLKTGVSLLHLTNIYRSSPASVEKQLWERERTGAPISAGIGSFDGVPEGRSLKAAWCILHLLQLLHKTNRNWTLTLVGDEHISFGLCWSQWQSRTLNSFYL